MTLSSSALPGKRPGHVRVRRLVGPLVWLLAILSVATFGTTTLPAQGGGAAVQISVDRAAEVSKVSPLIFGVNTASWDEQLFPGTVNNWELTFDQVGVRRVKDAGIRWGGRAQRRSSFRSR
ncbi:MAG: hypothetical protein ACM3ZU_04050 [Bacteroidota bacterium]